MKFIAHFNDQSVSEQCSAHHHSFRSPQGRLDYSAKPELLPLVRLSRDLPPFRARALFDGGYTSLVELAGADAHCLAELFLRCSPFRSAQRDGLAVSALENNVLVKDSCSLLALLDTANDLECSSAHASNGAYEKKKTTVQIWLQNVAHEDGRSDVYLQKKKN